MPQSNRLSLNIVFAFSINVVFNSDMDTKHEDSALIDELGGPTKVAELLGLDTANGGVQRVQNWTTRGIPPKEKLARPDLFLRNFTITHPESPQSQESAT